ncbi:MAG: TIGR01777 family oxidoreductase [Bacteroidetes bacterium]|nr:TIGR01777 family oxidoreductase [Bacteroidota bacterium]
MPTILISGGTGLTGTAMSRHLLARGYRVIVLSRNRPAQPLPGVEYAKWDIRKQQIDITALQQADHIIHLAGAGVMEHSWNEAYKKEIISSRADSAKLIMDTLQKTPNKVQSVISASAIGWYKATDTLHYEDEPADDSFLGTTCRLWEESVAPAEAMHKRLVKLRIGIVLSAEGGALLEFIKPLKLGVAAILGNGQQTVSWIHIDDLCRMFIHAIENETIRGVYNAAAPNPVTNKTLNITLAKKMKRRFYIPLHVPSFILKIILGERSIEILKSTAMSCEKIIQSGFSFNYTTVDEALEQLLQ